MSEMREPNAQLMIAQISRLPSKWKGRNDFVGVGMQPRRYGHVRVALQDRFQQRPNRCGLIGVVAIHHDQNIRVHLLEHGGDHEPLALPLLPPHDRARLPRNFGGGIGAVVVVHENGRLGQRAPEVGDDLADGFLLLIAGDQHRDGGSWRLGVHKGLVFGSGWGCPGRSRADSTPPGARRKAGRLPHIFNVTVCSSRASIRCSHSGQGSFSLSVTRSTYLMPRCRISSAESVSLHVEDAARPEGLPERGLREIIREIPQDGRVRGQQPRSPAQRPPPACSWPS